MKKKTSISDKTIKIINKSQIRPIPKWEFVIKNWGIWLGVIFSLIFLTIGFGVSWFGLIDNIITPYFWLILSSAFLLLAYLLFEKTKKSYRFQKWQVLALVSLVGLFIGGLVFKIGLASSIDRNFETNVPYYRHVVPMKMTVWNNPQAGYLSGLIISISKSNFEIKDFNGRTWTITGEPLVRGRVKMIIGEEVKLIGVQTDGNTFQASEVRPWNGMGQNMMKEN